MQKSLFRNSRSIFILIALFSIISISCSSNSSSGDTPPIVTPTNLVVSSEIVGQTPSQPTGNGSGVLNLTISANNATSFTISYGDGTTQVATSGKNTYTYTTAGTYTYNVTVTAFNGASSISSTLAIRIASGTSPVWSDEFNGSGAPDSTKWGYDLGAGGWGNNESQYYTNRADNVTVSNGTLKIFTKKESYLGSNYTSTRMLSKGKFSFKYGKIEFRAKLPAGGGTWPALWMLGDNIGTVSWPACGEIDVMEHVGNQLNKIHGTLHFPGRSGGNADTSNITISNATTEFHTYTVDWRASSIKFYVDDQLFKTFTNSASIPFNQNFFIIINCAMGGNFGGAIDPNFVSSTFEVDYVRVYN